MTTNIGMAIASFHIGPIEKEDFYEKESCQRTVVQESGLFRIR
jgi:hypothetical protein